MAGERYVTKNFERQLNFYQDILNFILQDTMFQNSGGLFSGTSNENRFYFYNKQLKEMLGLKNILNQSQVLKTINKVKFQAADELLKYKKLLEAEAITQEEYDEKKNQLLRL